MNCTQRVGWLLPLICLAATGARAVDQCDGPVLKLVLTMPNQTQQPPKTFYGVLATFGGIPLFNLSKPSPLVAADPPTGCGSLKPAAAGSVFLVQRGSCSFVDKFAAVLAAGGSGMLLYDDNPGCITMGGAISNSSSNSSSSSQAPARNSSQPPAISIDHADGLAMLQLLQDAAAAAAAAEQGQEGSGGNSSSSSSSNDVLLQFQLLEVPALDASALLLWLMAVGTVVAGSLWSGADYARELQGWVAAGPEDGRAPGNSHSSSSASDKHQHQAGMEVLEISAAGAVGFVVLSSAMLVLLYFFLNKAFLFVIVFGFCLAGAQALGVLLVPLLARLLPAGAAAKRVALPCCGGGSVLLPELLAAPAALAVAVVWGVFRNASWSWVLQDLLGIAVMLLVLRQLRLPNLRVACVLLPLCFLYDVWWVFIQPAVTGGGTSVMVEVAGGGDSHEFLPMLLRVPRLSGPPILQGAYSLLGFGDVILPGLLVALMRRLDIAGATGWAAGYFVAAVMGYGGGLLLTYVALVLSWFGDQGQPALLYLVPSTLGVVLLLAAARGELRALMAADGGGSRDDDGDEEEEEEGQGQQSYDDGEEDGEAWEEEGAGARSTQQQQQQQRLGSSKPGGQLRGAAALLVNAEQQGLLSGRR